MENFLLGFKVLFRIWADADFAAQVRPLLEGKIPAPPAPAPIVEAPKPAAPSAPVVEAIVGSPGTELEFAL